MKMFIEQRTKGFLIGERLMSSIELTQLQYLVPTPPYMVKTACQKIGIRIEPGIL